MDLKEKILASFMAFENNVNVDLDSKVHDIRSKAIDQFERLGAKVDDGRLMQLAQLLLQLERCLQASDRHRVGRLLEAWQGKSPQLRLKIFHLKQGLG